MQVARCECGAILCDGEFQGFVRVRCRNKRCGRRVWVISDGQELRLSMLDAPPQRMAEVVH